MKNTVTLIFMFSTFLSFTQKGSWYVGGNAGFSSSKFKSETEITSKRSSWLFSPEIGTFLMNRIQLGIGIVGNRITTELINQERNTYTAFGGRINSRYFFSELPLKPFIEVNIYSTLGNEKKQVLGLNMLPSIGTTFSFGSRLIFGLAYALNPRILILGSFGLIGYNSTSRTSSGGSETTFSGFDANINTLGERFTIGLYYTFFQNK